MSFLNTDLSGHLHGFLNTTRGAHLSSEYNNGGMSDTSSGKYGFLHLARHSQWYWRLQRRFDQQQYRCAGGLRWIYYCDLLVYKHLRTTDNDLPSHLHCGRSPTSQYYLPCTNHRSILPDAGRYQCSICGLAGHVQWTGWLQPCR